MTSPGDDNRARNPWQEREEHGWLTALAETIWALLLRPKEVFAATRPEEGLGGPLLFGLTLGVAGSILEAVSLGLANWALSAGLPEGLWQDPPQASLAFGTLDLSSLPGWAFTFLGCQLAALSVPILVVAYTALLFVLSGIVHLGLWAGRGLGNTSAGFRGTFSVTCYASVTALAQIVPVAGDLAYLGWMLVIQVIGLQAVHRTTRPRALLAALLPMLLLASATIIAVASALVQSAT